MKDEGQKTAGSWNSDFNLLTLKAHNMYRNLHQVGNLLLDVDGAISA